MYVECIYNTTHKSYTIQYTKIYIFVNKEYTLCIFRLKNPYLCNVICYKILLNKNSDENYEDDSL